MNPLKLPKQNSTKSDQQQLKSIDMNSEKTFIGRKLARKVSITDAFGGYMQHSIYRDKNMLLRYD